MDYIEFNEPKSWNIIQKMNVPKIIALQHAASFYNLAQDIKVR